MSEPIVMIEPITIYEMFLLEFPVCIFMLSCQSISEFFCQLPKLGSIGLLDGRIIIFIFGPLNIYAPFMFVTAILVNGSAIKGTEALFRYVKVKR